MWQHFRNIQEIENISERDDVLKYGQNIAVSKEH
jgi:hypothetical protein